MILLLDDKSKIKEVMKMFLVVKLAIAAGAIVLALLGLDAGADKVIEQIQTSQQQQVSTPQQQVEVKKYSMQEVRNCLMDLATVGNFNKVFIMWYNGEVNNSMMSSALRVQYGNNEKASTELFEIVNRIDSSDPVKAPLMKILESADRFRYQLNNLPLNYVNIMDSEMEMLNLIQEFDNKYK
jgi:hypothetical protein